MISTLLAENCNILELQSTKSEVLYRSNE